MINIEEITTVINAALNNNVYDEQFSLYSELKEYKAVLTKLLGDNAPIPGIVRSLGGDFVPLRELDSYKDTLSVEIFVPYERLENVRNVLTAYVTSLVGVTTVIGDYDVSFNIAPPSVGAVQDNNFGGFGVPVQLYIFMQIGKSALMSNNVHITINSEEVLLLNASIVQDVAVSSNTFEGMPNVESYPQSQVLMVSGVIPVQKTGISRTLKQMILNGDIVNQVFQIGYNDGQDTATYSMIAMSNCSFNLQSGAYATVSVTFTEAVGNG